MKKHFFTLISLCVFSGFSSAQEFSFTLYLKDAAGFRDTLVLGYDPLATNDIDPQFGETADSVQIIAGQFQAWASTFDNNTWNFCGVAQYDWSLSKKRITFGPNGGEANPVPILFSSPHYPVIASWDHTAFQDISREFSVITSWTPGGWFDATCFAPVLYRLSEQDSGLLEPPFHEIILPSGDTLAALFVGFISETNQVLSLQKKRPFSSYPNPFGETLQFTPTATGFAGVSIRIFDLFGRTVMPWQPLQAEIDVPQSPSGVYFVEFRNPDGQYWVERVLRL